MKKMNVKFLTGTAFAMGAAAALAGCTMPQPSVYGPAPTEQVETQEESKTEKTTVETTVEETFTPSEEVEAALYGPPDYFEDETFSPDTEVQEDVYGPPEWFD